MTAFNARRVCVVGDRLAPFVREALPAAAVELMGPEGLQSLPLGPAAPDIVIIDAECAAPDLLCIAIEALSRRAPDMATVLAGARLPTSLVRALLRFDRSDVLEAPFAAENLARIAAALLANAAAKESSASRCWSIVGSVGGCGATTIAIETAATLAAEGRGGSRVCLVDLNLADGAAAAYLGAKPAMLLSDAASAPERIDAALVQAFAAPVAAGFDLLASPRDPQAFAQVRAETVCRLLEVACQSYDSVVVDIPRHRQSWTLDVLAGSDEVLVVSELTVPALLSARALAGEIETDLQGAAAPKLILNRLKSQMFGPAPSLAEAEKAMQRKAAGGITSDWEAAAASVNLGGSIRQQRPKSKIVKDVERLVDDLLAEAAGRAAPLTRSA
ncbi:MAG TPA: AAA family ATPase [Caulobacteraceae bacterium]|jgi:pilus assembly protein CpaE